MPQQPLNALNGRHQLVMLAMLAGKSNDEIAQTFDLHPTSITRIKSSPLFQAQLDRLRRDLHERTAVSVVERLFAEGGRSLEVAVELRDHAESEGVRLSAAQDLMDRHPSLRKVQKTESEATVRVVFGREDVARIVGVMAEVQGGPSSPPEPKALPPTTFATPTAPPPSIRPETLEELLATLRAAEGGSDAP